MISLGFVSLNNNKICWIFLFVCVFVLVFFFFFQIWNHHMRPRVYLHKRTLMG